MPRAAWWPDMRLHTDFQHPDWHPIAQNAGVKIYLDGVLQKGVIAADEESGTIERLVDSRPGYHSWHVLPTEIQHGTVRIELPVGFEHLRHSFLQRPLV